MYQTRSIGQPAQVIDDKRIRGYAVMWDVVSPYIPEKFAYNSLTWEGEDVICTRNHDDDNLLGRLNNHSLTIGVDAVGLWFECSPTDTTIASDTKKLIASGDLRGCSFTFVEKDSHYDEQGVKVVDSAILYELGPVTQPCYPQTTVDLRRRNRPADATTGFDGWGMLQIWTSLLDTVDED